MASVKIKFRPSIIAGKEGTLFYQVIHNRVARQIHSGYKLLSSEWDTEHREIIIHSQSSINRCDYLTSLQKLVVDDISRLKRIIRAIDLSGKSYTADDIVELFSDQSNGNGYISFAQKLINQLKQIGKHRTAEVYTSALKSFVKFRKNIDVLLENIDSNLMVEYEMYLKNIGECPNSSSCYIRNLRAMYNRAVEKDLVLQRNPFKHFYIGIDKTIKRAVPLNIIRQLIAYTCCQLFDPMRKTSGGSI